MQWVPSEKKEQPEQELDQEPDDLTIAYMAGFYDGKNKYAPQPKPEQEPVAWFDPDACIGDECRFCSAKTKSNNVPLYTTPPQREWVGLTEEDMKEPKEANFDLLYGARWAERKLREKNT
jgi:hypothetical protein